MGHQDDILNKEVSSQDLWQRCLLLCLRLEVYDYHRLIGFLERLERGEKDQRVFLSRTTSVLRVKIFFDKRKLAVSKEVTHRIFWSIMSFYLKNVENKSDADPNSAKIVHQSSLD